MSWYKKTVSMYEIVQGINEQIRKEFSYTYRMVTFKPEKMFLISSNTAKDVELFISPDSVEHVQDIIEKYGFQISGKPAGGKIILIVGDQDAFEKYSRYYL